jgi:outer membrane biosynthesis protein TonB
MKPRELPLLLALFAAAAAPTNAQDSARALSKVTEHAPVLFPPLAHQARIAGLVHLQITTDGHTVIDVATRDGHPILAQAAAANVRTWKFADHPPGAFEATFHFQILKDKISFLKKPGTVDIEVPRSQEIEGKLAYTLPTSWTAKLKGPNGNLEAPLFLWTYGPELQGFARGPARQERALRNTHQDGSMMGFDAVLDDSDGQRLKFSLLGKKTEGQIKGVFLDDWGNPGMWTAVRSVPPAPDTCPAPPGAEEKIMALPEVTQHRQPDYPPLPFEAQIQGQVRLRVTTSTYCVAKVVRESGDPLLAEAAEANLRTWALDDHDAGTFEVTFNYRILEPHVAFLEQPGVVDVFGLLPVINGSTATLPAQTWAAHLTSARGDIQATFHFPYGCCSDAEVIAANGKREATHQSHDDGYGRMFGFDARLKTADGAPIKVSLIGKVMSRNRMKGVFLDYSGTAGAWTAELQHPPSRRSAR